MKLIVILELNVTHGAGRDADEVANTVVEAVREVVQKSTWLFLPGSQSSRREDRIDVTVESSTFGDSDAFRKA